MTKYKVKFSHNGLNVGDIVEGLHDITPDKSEVIVKGDNIAPVAAHARHLEVIKETPKKGKNEA